MATWANFEEQLNLFFDSYKTKSPMACNMTGSLPKHKTLSMPPSESLDVQSWSVRGLGADIWKHSSVNLSEMYVARSDQRAQMIPRFTPSNQYPRGPKQVQVRQVSLSEYEWVPVSPSESSVPK